jgi:hypothetical protein
MLIQCHLRRVKEWSFHVLAANSKKTAEPITNHKDESARYCSDKEK